MKLLIDNREKYILKTLEEIKTQYPIFASITYETSNLDLGDIIFTDDEEQYLLIFERKTIPDLIASIKDGRYNEQSFRLSNLEDIANHNIVYLIEGSTRNLTKDKQMVFSSLFSLNYYKGFSVIKTETITETCYYLLNSFLKMQKEKTKTPFYSSSFVVEEEKKEENEKKEGEEERKTFPSYSSFVKKKKNENITIDNFGEIVLCQIPSINSVTAIAIMKEYKTINNLIESLQKDPECLKNISYTTEKNQKRKVSKTCIENIKKFLISSSEN